MSFYVSGKFVYLAHPRTASMATEKLLQEVFPEGQTTKEHHGGIKNMHLYGNELIFCTIRDPIDVIVSWWILNQEWWDKGDIVNFINHYRHTYLQDLMFFHFDTCKGSCIRYESLQSELNKIISYFNREPKKLPIVNTTEDKPNPYSYYNREVMNVMWERFPLDMALYHRRVIL